MIRVSFLYSVITQPMFDIIVIEGILGLVFLSIGRCSPIETFEYEARVLGEDRAVIRTSDL